jgi:hypothetical protein
VIRPVPKPVPRPKKPSKPLRSRRRRRPRVEQVQQAFPKPTRPEGTKHRRRAREFGRMAFYAHLWCMLLDLARGGNAEPRHMEAWLACEGPIEVAHLGARAGWRRCSDDQTAPLCRKHHRQIDGKVGGRARWFVELGREGQREVREKLIRFAGYYWDGLTPEGRGEWDRRAAAERDAATRRVISEA